MALTYRKMWTRISKGRLDIGAALMLTSGGRFGYWVVDRTQQWVSGRDVRYLRGEELRKRKKQIKRGEEMERESG